MSTFRFAPIPAALPATVPFVGPETLERQMGRPFVARLGANENGFGPSPLAVQAMQQAAVGAWQYGDPTSYDLTQALATHLAVAPENIIVGEGIDGLLGLLVRLMIAPGDNVVTTAGGYPTFNYHVAGFGGVLQTVPYRDDAEDPAGLVAKARETGAPLVYLANPDNPMASWHKADTILAAIDDLPRDCLMVLDEAYGEFAPSDAIPDIAADDPRVIRMRTFSKAYGLAGARIGYAIGHPELIAGFDRIRNHFGLNRMAQAGALAALQDQDWLAETQAKVMASRARIGEIAAQNGIHALPSATNFVAIDTGRDGDYARALVKTLQDQGIFVRMPGVAPQSRCIRVSCGPEADMAALEAALQKALAAL